MIGSTPNPSGGRPAGRADQSQVGRAGPHPGYQLVGGVLDQGELDAGVHQVERRKGREQWGDGACGDHSDHEPTPDQPVHLVDGHPHGGHRGQYRARGLQGRRACRGQGRRPSRPVDQKGPQLVLELPDLGAHPGLADVHAVGRPGEVGLLGDRDEVLQLPDLHNQKF
jgi:hypothetical protein